jgi:hypothetical protein
VIVLVLVLVAVAAPFAPTSNPVELTAGDYQLVADVMSAQGHMTRHATGTLHLRAFESANRPRGPLDYRLFGWTDVDFMKIGAPIAPSATPGTSQDPDNPGVFAIVTRPFEISSRRSFAGGPVMLIGTLENTRSTRGFQDGGGIGLFVDAKRGQCMTGRWFEWGIAAGTRGRFSVCP